MQITNKVATEVASHEAIVRAAYKDSVGIWTWGIGITTSSGHSVERYIGNPQSHAKVMDVFRWALDKYAEDVRKAFAGCELTEEQSAAALSFHYNTGAILKASWVKHFKNGDMAAAKKSFMNWKKPSEIIPRRKKERDLFFDGKWSNDGTIPEYTRLTKSHTPVWGSRVNIDAAQCFAPSEPIEPELPPAQVTINGEVTPENRNAFAALIDAALSMFSRMIGGGKNG